MCVVAVIESRETEGAELGLETKALFGESGHNCTIPEGIGRIF